MATVKKDKIKTKELTSDDPYSVIAPLEHRLKVIANLIVDRIIEDQQSGSLRTKLQKNKNI